MSVKLMMTWDIAPEREQDYFEFVIGEFIPGVQRLGFQPVEAWATIYGDYPQIQVGILAEDFAVIDVAADVQLGFPVSGDWQGPAHIRFNLNLGVVLVVKIDLRKS